MADATLGPLGCKSARPIYCSFQCPAQKQTQTLAVSIYTADFSDAAASEGPESLQVWRNVMT